MINNIISLFKKKHNKENKKYDYFIDVYGLPQDEYDMTWEEFDKKFIHYCTYCKSWTTEPYCICYAR